MQVRAGAQSSASNKSNHVTSFNALSLANKNFVQVAIDRLVTISMVDLD
jgi:hypothetical protein